MFVLLPDSPVTARFLSKEERKLAVERLRADQTGIENKTLKPYQVLEAFKDYKTYFFFALATVANIPNGGISNFGMYMCITGHANIYDQCYNSCARWINERKSNDQNQCYK
jgi:hypothetical protein